MLPKEVVEPVRIPVQNRGDTLWPVGAPEEARRGGQTPRHWGTPPPAALLWVQRGALDDPGEDSEVVLGGILGSEDKIMEMTVIILLLSRRNMIRDYIHDKAYCDGV